MMQKLIPENVAAVLGTGDPARVDLPIPAKFKAGDRVTVQKLNKIDHNRLPSYIKGATGTITFDHGVFVFPDTSAHRMGPKPQHVYTVVFTAQELYGSAGHKSDRMYVDVWDDYLETA